MVPNVQIPILRLPGVKLETRVGALIEQTKLDGPGLLYILGEDVPTELLSLPPGQLVYLHGEVCALTTQDYLRSVSPDLTLAALFQGSTNEHFYPFSREYISDDLV